MCCMYVGRYALYELWWHKLSIVHSQEEIRPLARCSIRIVRKKIAPQMLEVLCIHSCTFSHVNVVRFLIVSGPSILLSSEGRLIKYYFCILQSYFAIKYVYELSYVKREYNTLDNTVFLCLNSADIDCG